MIFCKVYLTAVEDQTCRRVTFKLVENNNDSKTYCYIYYCSLKVTHRQVEETFWYILKSFPYSMIDIKVILIVIYTCC